MAKSNTYTHRKKGGSYEIVIDSGQFNTIKCAGTLKGLNVILYRSTVTGEIFLRERQDFHDSMVQQ